MLRSLRAGAPLSGIAVLLLAPAVRAAVIEIGPNDDLIAAVGALSPGDELVLQGGTYSLNPKFTISVSGTDQAPIVIRAKDGEIAIVTRPDANQNTINVEGAQHVVLRGLEVTGGSHGIRMASSSFITIEDCHIHDTDDVALSANVPGGSYEGLRILRNHIHDTNNTGEGMYLGCNNDGCRVHDSLIEGNWVHHMNGPTIVQGDGIELKEGSYANVIRDNVIHDTNYPCILTYSTVGNGGPNVIERNVMWGCGDHGIQVAADAVIRNNIVLSANADGIRNQPHQSGAPSNLVVVHNTVLKANGDAYRASGVVGSLVVANNALYANAPTGNALRIEGDTSQVTSAGNVGLGGLIGVMGFSAAGDVAADFVAASFSGAPPNDPFPKVGGALVASGDPGNVAMDDFNGTARGGVADVGAYKFDAAGNPGWPIGPGFKDSPPGSGGAGGGGGAGAGPGSGGAGSGGDTSGSAAGGGPSGGSSGTAAGSGAANRSVGAEDEGACGCRMPADRSGPTPGMLAFAGLCALSALRRHVSLRRAR